MKTISFFFAAVLLLTLHACQRDDRARDEVETEEVNTDKQTPVKLIEYLVGDWEMVQSTGGGEGGEARNDDGSPGERLTFTAEARYIVHDGGQKRDSGAYRMNEQLNNLYLESEANENPVEYEINLEPETMTLKPNDGGPTYMYRRVGPDPVLPGDRDEPQGNTP